MRGIRFSAEEPDSAPLELDASQRRVVELPLGTSAAIIGAPGSGKTTALLETLAARVTGGVPADALLVLAPSRLTATRLRDAVALRLDAATDGPRVRTVPSLAFELVAAAARRAGAPTPRLITGGEQDADMAELLATETPPAGWPDELHPAVRSLRSFRSELREVLARVTERGMTPADLVALGARTGRAEWEASGRFLARYLDVVAEARPDQLDAAELARFAIRAIDDGTAGPRIDALRAVFVDDTQEATESTLAVLRALARRGIPIVAFGEPDIAANAFRGGDPGALGRLGAELGTDVETIVLDTVHRHGPAVRAVVSAAVGRVGAASAGSQRAAAAVPRDTAGYRVGDRVERITALSPAREAAAVARRLREAHLLHGVPWNRMLVVVRSGARVPSLARALALADVPTRGGSGGVALRDDPSARALLTVVEVGIRRRPLDPETVEELLLGPFGGLDPLELRHLRRALRAEEVAGDGSRPTGELLVEAIEAPGRLVTVESRWARKASRLADTLFAVEHSDGTIEDLLWLVWERSGLATPWRDQALGSGLGSAEANRRLDAIVALFTTAKRFAERRPDATPLDFLAEVLDAEVPEDILLPRPVDEAVLVATPSGTVGLEADLVVVTGLQQGVWPNLRPRGTLLHPQAIAAAASGTSVETDERKSVLDDEIRMFALAVSRSAGTVLLTAVANDDEQPSPLLRLGGDGAEPERVEERDPEGSGRALPLSLRGTVGGLRRIAVSGRDPRRRVAAAETLALLAREQIPGADPVDWLGLGRVSTDRPLYDGRTIPVSPSRVDRLEDSPLDWFLDEIAGSDPGVTANIGTIVHWAMETADDPHVEAVWSAIESRWGELVFDSPWIAERQRRLTRILAEGLSAYLEGFAASGKALVGAERRFVLPLEESRAGAVEVRGSIDRVERARDGSVVIVDLKTGNPIAAAKVPEHPQLGAYQLAFAEGVLDGALAEAFPGAEHSSGGAKLVFVKSARKGARFQEAEQEVFDPERLAAVRQRLADAAGLIAAAEFRGLLDVPDLGPIDRSSLRLQRTFDVTSDGIEAP